RVSVLGFSGTVTYHLRFSSGPTLAFEQDAIVISGRVEAETSTWWAPNGFVRFRQRFTLALDTNTQAVNPEVLGDPEVDTSWFIPTSLARNVVRNEVRNALNANAPAIRKVFRDAKNGLVSSLRSFEPSVGGTYTSISISAAGVIVRGDISSAPRIGPIIQVESTDSGAAFSALESWIPGGGIARFDWSWIEYPGQATFPWGGVVRFASEVSRFTLDKPPGIDSVDRVCLRVHGTRIRPDGSSEQVSGGAACQIQEPEISFDAPSWFDAVMVPVWTPGADASAAVNEAIAAHVSLQSDRPSTRPMQNAVIFFPDVDDAAPFDVFTRALLASKRRESRLAVFVILPEGSFAASRRELEARLENLRSAGRFQVAEDVQGGWSRTFGVTKRPALFVMNSRRRFAAHEADRMDPSAIAETIDRHVLPAPTRSFRPLRLLARPGETAPDFDFALDGEEARGLHRMRGRSVVVSFCQLWSAPCIKELRRLDAMANKGREDQLVLAFYGGAAPVDVEAFKKEHGLTLPLLHDAEHRAARRFGVRCWPTTITIDPELRIEQVQLGVETEEPHKQAAS
ncbi:MAG TPA: TlpA disulfide reductase family protein, partial [Rhodothermales bacterium]